jgi:hypothetical protein
VIDTLPVPDPAVVAGDSHGVVVEAVHEHPAGAVTVTLVEPAAAPRLSDAGDTE